MTSFFGKTSAPSGSSASSANKTSVSAATPSSSGTVIAGHAYLWMSSGATTTARMVIYADSSGAPGSLLAESDALTVSVTTTNSIVDFTFSGANQISITSGTQYWVGVSWQAPTGGSLNEGRDGTASTRYEASSYLANPFGTPTILSGPVAANIEYSTGANLTGSGSATFGSLTGSATGQRTKVATAATAALGGLTASATGIRVKHGTGSATLGSLAASATGFRTRGGTGTAALGFTASATGKRTTFGTAAATLGFAATAAGVKTTQGSGAAALGSFVAHATGFVPSFDVIPAVPTPSDDLHPSPSGLTPYQPPWRPPNPNWPVVGFEVDFTQGPPWTPSDQRQSINVGYRRLNVRGFSIQRGRQYELDQVQSGTLTLDLPDPDELLNPDNTASPYNRADKAYNVTPYRAVQVWAMWPSTPGAGNIINGNVDATYDPTFEAGTGGWSLPNPDGLSGVDGNISQTTAAAFLGTTALQVQQDGNGHERGAFRSFCTAPGVTYTFSAYVYPLSGTNVWIRVEDALGGVFLSEVADTDSTWQRISVTWTAVDTLEAITIFGIQPDGSSPPSFFVDATMLNFGEILEPFQVGGPVRYRLYTGYVERWPSQYDNQGLRALRPLEAVDALAMLSRTEIHQSYDAEIATDLPSIYFPLNNTAPPAGAANLGTGFGVGGRVNNVVAANGQINWGGDQLPDGSPAVTFTAQNPNDPPTSFPANSFTEMAVIGGAVSLNPVVGFTVEVWAKWTSGTAQVGTLELLAIGDPRGLNFNVPAIGWTSWTNSTLNALYNPDGATAYVPGGSGPPPDGQWHHMALSLQGTTLSGYLDGAYLGKITVKALSGHLGLNTFYMEATTQYSVAQAQVASARFAVYPGVVTADRIKAHYDRGTGHVGEFPGARVTRLLDAYWSGAVNVAPGSVGMAEDFNYDTRTMLDVLQEIQETERGLLYADRFGTVVFEDRHSRYGNQQSIWTFGEGTDPFAPLNQNADFSGGMASWTVYGGTAGVSPLAWHSAPQSAAFLPDGVTAYPCLESNKVPVTAGVSYSASCWALCPGGYAGASASINWYDSAGLYLSTSSAFSVLPADTWVQLQVSAHPPAGAAFGTVLPTLIGIPTTSVLTYFDDAQLVVSGQAVEYPYSDYAADHDPTYVFTEFDLTRPDNQNFAPIVNQASEIKYGQRIASQEVQVTTDFDLDQAGIYYTSRYGDPKTRISKLVLNPAANPALWAVVLSLEISQRVRVVRRSPGFTYSAEYYIEQITHKVTAANGVWTVELQCSPVFVPQAWVLADPSLGVLGSSTTPVY